MTSLEIGFYLPGMTIAGGSMVLSQDTDPPETMDSYQVPAGRVGLQFNVGPVALVFLDPPIVLMQRLSAISELVREAAREANLPLGDYET